MTRRHRDSRGQIIPLFALSLVAMLAMGALLFDGAQALQIHRRIQDAADAAALAGANVIQSGTTRTCSGSTTSTTPRADVVAAVNSSVTTNLPGYTGPITVTCATGWKNYAVSVALGTTAPTFLGGVIGIRSLPVSASATALYGQMVGAKFSVVMLDPYNPTWKSGIQGCPSVLFSGGPTITFDGSVQIDSACPAGYGGALGTNGTAATLTFAPGMSAHIVGGYSPTALTINPTPLTGQPYVKDPLAGITMTRPSVVSTKTLVLNNQTSVLSPGTYVGGIQLKNKSVAVLLPGIYYLDGGGLDVGAQASVFSVAPGVSTSSVATWPTDCPPTTCGVLLYNTGTSSTLSPITVGAGATVELRPYLGVTSPDPLQGLLIWQYKGDATTGTLPSPTYQQPAVTLNGGGTVNLSGTVYAPSAQVFMTGGSGGSGGGVDLTLQFIAWDLQIQGNSSFHFYYNSDTFAKPFDYGLVQ